MDYKPTFTTFAQRLRYLRRQRNLTQHELAAKVTVKPSTIAAYETGRVNPSVDSLVSISKALGVSLYDLIGD